MNITKDEGAVLKYEDKSQENPTEVFLQREEERIRLRSTMTEKER